MLLPVILPCEAKNHESEDGFVVDVKGKVGLEPKNSNDLNILKRNVLRKRKSSATRDILSDFQSKTTVYVECS